MKTISTLMLLLLSVCQLQQAGKMNEISKNNMLVKWQIEGDLIHFEMEAPTKGWVTIGFNETENLAGAYLLMGRISGGQAEVVEHYTASPGSYQPLQQYGIMSQVQSITGTENAKHSVLKFSIPIAASSKYHKNLLPTTEWNLIMAYSADDDFQHHSMMRTAAKIKL